MPAEAAPSLKDELERGLDAPICITWELTYACNLACVHCLSASGRRDPRELTDAEAVSLIDELAAMGVFYVNVGGGEPMLRASFFDLIEHATGRGIGVKFSTNGTRLNEAAARRLARMDNLDIQVSLDGATAGVNDAVRGESSYAAAIAAMDNLAAADFGPFKLSVVATRDSLLELDALVALADRYGAQLRITRLRPSGRAIRSWDDLRPTSTQLVSLHAWLLDHQEVLTGDSFFHLSALGKPLAGLNMCGAGRVVCLVDPVGDVYACPFVIDEQFRAGNVRSGGFGQIWRASVLFSQLRSTKSAGACASCGSYDACRGGCLAAKFFTGLDLAGPDPECVLGHGATSLDQRGPWEPPPLWSDHSRRVPIRLIPRG
ncbi:MAG: mycofactocin radical SAM maturase [Acidimicrobiales bacterium]